MTAERTKTFEPDYAVAPGETIVDLLEEHDMTQTELADRLGVSLKHLNQIVNGGASISAELALALEKVFGAPAPFWLNRESLYRAQLARQDEESGLETAVSWAERFPITELKKREYLPRRAQGSALVSALLQFLGVASPAQWRDPTVSFRKSQKWKSDPYALAAWLRVGEMESRDIECEPFNSERFRDALDLARSLTRQRPEEWQDVLVSTCAAAGVAVVVVDTFEKARANGATRWLTPNKALIQLSLRYRWEDIFWFTFFHEAGHVLLHRKKEVFVEPASRAKDEDIDPKLLELETEADRFASRTLIPARYERRLPHIKTQADVIELAGQLGIAPAIVVGRLHYEELWPYSHGRGLRRQFAFADSASDAKRRTSG